MVRQPQNLAEAKQIFREEKQKFTTAVTAVAGSRWLMAVLAAFVLGFGTHVIFAPARLPAIERLNVAQLGLPPLDFGVVGEQAGQAIEAAERQDAGGRVQEFVTANPERVPLINKIGFGAALVLLLGNMWLMTKRRRFSRG